MRNINNDKRLYSIYHNMKNRCYYKKSNRYYLMVAKGYKYVMNGITVTKHLKNGHMIMVTIVI